jgi:uncharacterized protein YaiL (DUF2058 family)
MSLRDELLKAGLVSSDKAKKLDSDGRKQDYQRKKGQALIPEEEAQRAEARKRVEADSLGKREQDRQLNRAREAEKKCREQVARAHQLIEAHRVNESEAEIAYNVQNGNRIRTVRVTAQQRRALAMGRLAIVRGDRRELDFALVPREIAQKLVEFAPDRVLLLHPESSGIDPDDEWGDWE